jgi:hypothetical protein
MPRGCANRTTVSSCEPDHSGRWDHDDSLWSRVTSRAVTSRQPYDGFAQVITSSYGRASRCVRCDRSTAKRVSAGMRDADCDFPGCERPHYALGHCQGHRRQMLDNRPLAPLRERSGRHMDRGHVLLYEPRHPNARKDGFMAEHTKVMAETLGRPLERFEEVHHKNGLRSVNRPENLELWARGMQPPGSRVSDLIDAAVRVLRIYRPELLSASALGSNATETQRRRE